jgi:hypothetical protein
VPRKKKVEEKKPKTPRKKKEEPKKPELILTYTEHHTGGSPLDYDDEWSSCEPERIEWSPDNIYIDEPIKKAREKTKTWNVECLECNEEVKPGDTLYLVIVRYSTGNTFTNISGAWHIAEVLKDREKAYEIEKQIWQDYNLYKNHRYDHKKLKKESVYSGYKPWSGYFEDLESVEVESFIVK